MSTQNVRTLAEVQEAIDRRLAADRGLATAARIASDHYRCTGCGRDFTVYDYKGRYGQMGISRFENLNAARARKHASKCRPV